ncbi:hypothetical protein FB451DRAFT_1292305 [Mycena latifolia]|nr:hypothetical protein FB451DRAFT_1292305 [Mycena latifolia]
MTSPLGKTWGIWLLGLFLQAILYGMALLQVYLYFFWKFKDGWGIRGATFQMGTYFSGTYSESFAHLLATWAISMTLVSDSTSRYFANCIYRLHSRDRVMPMIILCLAIGSLSGGIETLFNDIHSATFSQLGRTTFSAEPGTFYFMVGLDLSGKFYMNSMLAT